jgi:hypothetical protein
MMESAMNVSWRRGGTRPYRRVRLIFRVRRFNIQLPASADNSLMKQPRPSFLMSIITQTEIVKIS